MIKCPTSCISKERLWLFYLTFEVEPLEERVQLKGSRFDGALRFAVFHQPDDLSPADGSSEARALHDLSAGLRVGCGPGRHCDVGGIFQMLLVTHCQEVSCCTVYLVF